MRAVLDAARRPLLRAGLGVAGLVLVLSSCQSTADLPPPDAAMSQAGTGGEGGSAGETTEEAGVDAALDALDAPLGTGDAGDPYLCEKRPKPDPGGSASEGQPCCDGLGTCTKSTAVGAAIRPSLGLDACRPGIGLLCAPRSVLGADAMAPPEASTSVPASCRSTLDAEGRCIKPCFLRGNAGATNFPHSTCLTGELCAPCFSPVTRLDTGACQRPGDAPTESPKSFAPCGAPGEGLCVPMDAVPPGSPTLHQVECEPGLVCAPKRKVQDINSCFAHCKTGSPLPPLPGACVPKFVLDPAQQDLLQQMSCAAGDLCAPCVNPFDGQPTGACT